MEGAAFCSTRRRVLLVMASTLVMESLTLSSRQLQTNEINWQILDQGKTGPHGRVIVYTADRNWRQDFNDDDEHWCTDEEECPYDREPYISVWEMAQLTHDNIRCESAPVEGGLLGPGNPPRQNHRPTQLPCAQV